MLHIIAPTVIISILYFIVKWLKQKRLDKGDTVKSILNDTIFVFLTSGLSLYLYDNMKSFLVEENTSPFVFTDQPNF